MKRFLFRVAIFSVPVFIFMMPSYFYHTDKGDLMRIGYFPYFQDYNKKHIFREHILTKQHYKGLGQISLDTVSSFDVITIGDSFSNLDEDSYQNYLSVDFNQAVLNVDNLILQNYVKGDFGNPLEFLARLLDSDFFSKVKARYVVLESVERSAGNRSRLTSCDVINLTYDTISKIHDYVSRKKQIEREKSISYFDRAYKFNMNNIFRLFHDKGYKSNVYSLSTTHPLFSYDSRKVLFFDDELKAAKKNADKTSVRAFNNILNDLSFRLAAKGIQLIFLPAPDKYSVYYQYISNHSAYPKPFFFDLLGMLPKAYTYIDTKAILDHEVRKRKDVYLYDDTHWSPIAARVIASQIMQKIDSIRILRDGAEERVAGGYR